MRRVSSGRVEAVLTLTPPFLPVNPVAERARPCACKETAAYIPAKALFLRPNGKQRPKPINKPVTDGAYAGGARPRGCVLYNEGMQAQWRETTVGEHGELVLEGLPFDPGQPVEVLVVSKTAGSTTAGGRSLRESVLEFREPLEPVASEDWDALQ
jgi:hypothetical protein